MQHNFVASSLTPEVIESLFEENEYLLAAVLENQKLGKVTESSLYQDILHKNISFLASLSDFYPNQQPLPRRLTRRTVRAHSRVNDPRLIEIATGPEHIRPQPLPQSNYLALLSQLEIPPTVLKLRSNSTTKKRARKWTAEENASFLEGKELYGKNYKKIADHIKTRNATQVRSRMQKYLLKLKQQENTQPTFPFPGTSDGSHDQ